MDRVESIYCEEIQKTKDANSISVEIAIVNEKAKFWSRIWPWGEKPKTSEQNVSIFSLFRYATKKDFFYLFTGLLASVLFGCIIPAYMVTSGAAVNAFTNRVLTLCAYNFTAISQQHCPSHIVLTPMNFYDNNHLCNYTEIGLEKQIYDLKSKIRGPMIITTVLGVVCILLCYIRVICLRLLSERQSRIIRENLYRSILEKNFNFLDEHHTGEFGCHLTNTIEKLGNGIGEKLGSAVESISTLIASLIIAFVKGWKLSLVLLSLSPTIILAMIVLFKVVSKMTQIEQNANAKASSIAEEVISSIRTVFSLNGQEKEKRRYEKHLDDARKCGIKKGLASGISIGISCLIRFSIFALGFWYGEKLARQDGSNIGDIFTTILTINLGIFAICESTPFFEAIFEARIAAFTIWKIIDDTSVVDKQLQTGFTKDQLIGDIRFANVHFSYPSRPKQPILNDLSFDVKHGQTIALVGSSGSGKSTCLQLLQRFYNPTSGSILIDDKPINEYNLTWLRQHIGVVSQEPVLFHTTIRQNILFGRQSATDEEIHQAAKMANAHDFIMTLPDKYETQVGERGSALSGGQKQRIAIARALLHDPKILLLDEATSALDNESEKMVQKALDRAAEGRTTIIIAHRLSTIENADKIIVMQQGVVVEEGTHETLMKEKGVYYNLVQQQNHREAEEEKDLALEQQEMLKILFSQSSVSSYISGYARQCTVLSLAPSVKATLFGKCNTDDIEAQDEIDEDICTKKEERKSVNRSLIRLNRPEWLYILFGCIAAGINGSTIPLGFMFQSKLTTAFQECDVNEQKHKVQICTWVYISFGFVSLICSAVQGWLFSYSGEAVTKRMRSKAFEALLRQEIGYFDEPNHCAGVLCSRLANDGSAVQGATGIRIGLICQQIVLLICGVIIAFAYSWRVTLCVVGFVPLLILGGVLQTRITGRLAKKSRETIEMSGKIALESIQNIRTVIQLTRENYFFEKYSQLLNDYYKKSLKYIHAIAIVFGLSDSFQFFGIATFLYTSVYFIEKGMVTYEDALIVLYTIVITGRFAGRVLMLLPDYGKASQAAENIFDLIRRKPLINNDSKDGDEIENFSGGLEFQTVFSVYPTRPESVVLRNLTLDIKPGQHIAFVGTSGSGKSTTIQMIERFYDPNIGAVLADSKDIRSLNLHWYRSQIGLVSQEPVLFDMSIKENIAYGDNSRNDIPIEQIIDVAKQANIHDFILTLPQGYDTSCGAKGAQLSGGQKQRIAIARALIRNPKILLLDEATSALDSESEKIVQEALDRAQENRTSITVAHRLSTIRNADVICVLRHGMIVESGSHDELMALGGRYFRLVQGKNK